MFVHISQLVNLPAMTEILICKNVGLSAVLASDCYCDIALKFIKQIRTSKQLLKTWPTLGSCSASLSSFLYITHLLASATLR